MVKIDFAQLLQRRRVPLARWLEEEGIASKSDYVNWKMDRAEMYTFSPEFDRAVIALLPTTDNTDFVYAPYIPLVVSSVTKDIDNEILESMVEAANAPSDMVEEPKKAKRTKDKKQVQSDEKDE